MSNNIQRPFEEWAPRFRELGMYPRPIMPDSKACKASGWQVNDDQLAPGTYSKWIEQFGHYGIGLLMGSQFPDGTRLGAVDVDRDEYVALANVLLGQPICGRFGKKGMVYFVRVQENLGNPEFKVKGAGNASWGKVTECLFDRKLCVIPPTRHPCGSDYRWIGTPLHEVDFEKLPLIGNAK